VTVTGDNRLARATSPYLLQHKDNPVDWREWGEEAFAEATRLDRPILLSVGYAACHWCHVMAHESFEDEATAAQMNDGFINIKVDREERPDVDAVYMSATQALTGQGGWPMTVFLTPEGQPFYAGTYFPPQPRHGIPSFRQVLTAITDTWAERKADVLEAGRRISAAISRTTLPTGSPPPDVGLVQRAVIELSRAEDRERGGFGGAPKFPPSMVCEFLLRHASTDAETASTAREIADRTLIAMARSGMYDQLAGGFARYSVDAAWVVPHFEKMLYDNAQLARVYLHWWRLTGEPTGARIALETCDWMLRELGTAQGGLASSLDADTPVPDESGGTHGVEGYTYVWTPQQLVEQLGEQEGEWVARLCAVTPAGTFEHGASTLQLTRDVWADPEDGRTWSKAREQLLMARLRRPQPGRDDKVVAAWNGLAIAALAETGALLDRPDLIAAAERIATLLLGLHLVDSRLRRVSREGVVGVPGGVLDDYADVAEGLLALHAVTGRERWLTAAGALLDVVLADFVDESGVHDTPASVVDPALSSVRRPADPADNATPSGTSAAAGALLSYAALTGSAAHREAAEFALSVAGAAGDRAPQGFGWALAVAQAGLDGPREVAIVGPDGDEMRNRLHRVALNSTAPGLVISVGVTDAPGVPLLAGRPVIDGRPAAFVCRGFSCDLPATDPAVLAEQLR
jgi:uncharacterized protein YyaL (SSP411 family)